MKEKKEQKKIHANNTSLQRDVPWKHGSGKVDTHSAFGRLEKTRDSTGENHGAQRRGVRAQERILTVI